jgi:hypothetical protein
MDAISRQPREAETIKSVTLADLEFGRPSPFDQLKGLARMALMLWGALSFGAAAGTAVYYFAGTSGGPLLLSQAQTASAKPVPAAKAVAAAKLVAAAKPSASAAPERDASLLEIPPHLVEYVGPEGDRTLQAQSIIEARLPRPRPDEPFYTGSIGAPRVAHARRIGPCETIARLGGRFIFGMRCQQETRYYAPPPPSRYYSPAPYQPPTVVR